MARVLTKRLDLLAIGLAAVVLVQHPVLADEAGGRRLAAAIRAIDAAPQLFPTLTEQLVALEGVEVLAADAALVRPALGPDQAAALPLLDVLQSFTVRQGVARLSLSQVTVLKKPGKSGSLTLAREVSFVLRPGANGAATLDDLQGVRGSIAGLSVELRRLEVTNQGDKLVGKADCRLPLGMKRTFTFDLGPAPGLVGAVNQ